MIRFVLCSVVVASLNAVANAAIAISSENAGRVTKQYFEQGEFVLMQDDKPSMGMDAEGRCWFIDRGRLVADSCDEMLQSMQSMRDRLVDDLSAEDRAILQRAMQMQREMPALRIRRIGKQKIAGYTSECHAVGARRQVCISTRLLEQVRQEMGDSRFSDMLRRFSESAADMGVESPEAKAVKALTERGFPMLDKRQVADVPVIDSAILKTLPEAERNEVLDRMGSGGVVVRMRGNRVSSVEQGVAMPELDFSHYRRISFEEFLERSTAPRFDKWAGFPPAGD